MKRFAMGMVLAFAAIAVAHAHPGGVSKRDGCHRDKAAGNMHFHADGGWAVVGLCERRGKITIKTVEKLVEVKTPAKVIVERVEIKSPDVEAFDRAFSLALDRLDRAIASEARRPPRVVEREVEVFVKDSAQASASCTKLRSQYLSCEGRWGCDDAGVAKKAIAQGCW